MRSMYRAVAAAAVCGLILVGWSGHGSVATGSAKTDVIGKASRGVLAFFVSPVMAKALDVHSIQHGWKSGGVWYYSAIEQVEEATACEHWGHGTLGAGTCTTSGVDSLHPNMSINESIVQILD